MPFDLHPVLHLVGALGFDLVAIEQQPALPGSRFGLREELYQRGGDRQRRSELLRIELTHRNHTVIDPEIVMRQQRRFDVAHGLLGPDLSRRGDVDFLDFASRRRDNANLDDTRE